MFKKWIAGAALLVMSGMSHAGFVHTDWETEGDQLATLHEETGIEWLKVTNTLGMSVDQVLAQTGAGGQFDGWRLPTAQEIVDLWFAMFDGSSMLSNPQGTRNDYSYYGTGPQNWVEYMGEVTSSPIRSYGFGYKTNGELGFFGVSRAYSTTSYWYGYGNYPTSTNGAYYGVMLVSDGGDTLSSKLDPSLNIQNPKAPVNQVSAPLLSAALLLPLAGWLRRRRAD